MAEIKVYGAPWCPDCRRSKQFLGEQRIGYDWFDGAGPLCTFPKAVSRYVVADIGLLQSRGDRHAHRCWM